MTISTTLNHPPGARKAVLTLHVHQLGDLEYEQITSDADSSCFREQLRLKPWAPGLEIRVDWCCRGVKGEELEERLS
jgi:hypothetical protein